MNKKFLLLTTIAILLQVSCSQPLQTSSGSSSETVIGRVLNEDGSVASATAVTLLPGDYNPVTGKPLASYCFDTTDETGGYAITVPMSRAAHYSLQAVNLSDRTRALVTGIRPSSTKGAVTVQYAVLKKSGTIRILLPDTLGIAHGFIYIPGTTLLAHAVSGSMILDSVPVGIIPAVNYLNTADSARSHTIRTNLTVSSADTVSVADLHDWKYSRRLYLNTTVNGADVSGTVLDFPVLVRLTGSNFVFSQAGANGADCRFTKPDGTPLPFEIERWDADGQQAEVWVKVDTVHGNDSTRYIAMFWGAGSPQTLAGLASNSTTVFDTADGFQGVWHFSETGDAAARDATANRYNGTPFNMGAGSTVPGPIGVCRSFGGDSSYYVMTGTAESRLNFPKDGSYTLSAWVYTDTVDGLTHAIADKGDNQYNLEQWYFDKWQFSEFKDKTGWEVTSSPMTAKTWTHLCGVRNGNRQYLFVDGRCVDSVVTMNPYNLEMRYTGFDFMVGRTKCFEYTDRAYYFKGKIEEVEASNTARSVDWVKLSYMNQKSTDALIKYK